MNLRGRPVQAKLLFHPHASQNATNVQSLRPRVSVHKQQARVCRIRQTGHLQRVPGARKNSYHKKGSRQVETAAKLYTENVEEPVEVSSYPDATHNDEQSKLRTGSTGQPAPSQGRNLFVAGGCVALLVCTWVGGAVAIQSLQEGSGITYDKPYFSRWVAQASLAMYFPILFIFKQLNSRFAQDGGEDGPPASAGAEDPLLDKQLLLLAFPLSLVYLAEGTLWYLSLSQTSVSLNTALYQACVPINVLLSALFLEESIAGGALVSLAAIVGGLATVGGGGEEDGATSLAGVGLVLGAALLYSAYKVCFSKFIKPRLPGNGGVRPVVGWAAHLGLATACYGLLLIPALNSMQVEEFALPPLQALPGMAVAASTLFLYQPLLFTALRSSSPIFVSSGCLLTIPASMVVQRLQGHPPDLLTIVGSLVVGAGCISLNYTQYSPDRQRTR